MEEAKSVSEPWLQAQLYDAQWEAAAIKDELTERIRSLLAESCGLEGHQHQAPSSMPRPFNLSGSSSTSEPCLANTSPKRRLTLPAPPPEGQEISQQPLSLAMLGKQGAGTQSPVVGPHSRDQRNASPTGNLSRPHGDATLRINMAPLSRANALLPLQQAYHLGRKAPWRVDCQLQPNLVQGRLQ
ncbi:hypothetical protein WJX74_004244 [Apatococcus lobatus]|uniref:Uncharacterized protein n=1 Tax=Apatococcus lobatus TaxID=904363 RepID=A0AAW1RIX2_9CHLO